MDKHEKIKIITDTIYYLRNEVATNDNIREPLINRLVSLIKDFEK